MSKKNNPTLEILICTMNEGVNGVIDNMLPQLGNVLVTISHQVTDKSYISRHQWPEHVQYLTLHNVGVSKNRNNALQHARGDICLIADDDLEYMSGFEQMILDTYQEHPEAAAITFQAEGLERWSEKFAHNWRTIGQICEVTISFKKSWVNEHGIIFDEQFGLRARYPQGEGNIFLADIRKAEGKVVASPEVIVQHPDISSGYIFTPERVTAKVATARRMYGWWAGIAALVVFAITKHKHYKKDFSAFSFVRYGIKALGWSW